MLILASAAAARTASFVGGIVAASTAASRSSRRSVLSARTTATSRSVLAPVLSLALGVSFEILVIIVNGLAEEGLSLDLGRMLALHSAGSALRCRWNLSSPLAPALGCIFSLTLPSLDSKDMTDDEGSQGDTYTCRRVDNPEGHSFAW